MDWAHEELRLRHKRRAKQRASLFRQGDPVEDIKQSKRLPEGARGRVLPKQGTRVHVDLTLGSGALIYASRRGR